MSIVGYTAAQGVFLDIPPLLRGLAQSLFWPCGPKIRLSKEMNDEVKRMPDPEDATEMVEEYDQAWWTESQNWQTTQPPLLDLWPALEFHITRVRF
jgi:hypothetical protein